VQEVPGSNRGVAHKASGIHESVSTPLLLGRTGRFHANLVLTCRGKRLPLVARTAGVPDVFSNSCRALPLLTALLGGFEPRRPRQFFSIISTFHIGCAFDLYSPVLQ
jgi:hypothetical protein